MDESVFKKKIRGLMVRWGVLQGAVKQERGREVG